MTARRGLVMVTLFAVTIVFATVAVAAPPGAWPSKKGERCWLATAGTAGNEEYSLVIAQITNMGNDHYLFHGQAWRVTDDTDWTPLGGLQPFSGNAEIEGSDVIGQLTKVEVNAIAEPDVLETYTGMFLFDLGTLVGEVEGIISVCDFGGDPACNTQINTGPIPLTPVSCP